MQNKGAIKVFAIAFALVCLYQLSFTLVTKNVERKAHKFAYNEEMTNLAKQLANGDQTKEAFLVDSLGSRQEEYYLDSVSNLTAYNFLWMRKFSYKECKSKEINLGLDLKGGMNVMMEVSTSDVVRALANNTTDSTFNKAVELALKKQRSTSKNFVQLFGESMKEIAPEAKLAGYFATQMREKIKLTDDNDKVLAEVQKEVTSAYDRTYQILRQRIDKFGVAQPTIQKLEATERILIELPGVKEPERVRNLLQGTAQLEFWLAANLAEVYPYIEKTNEFIAATQGAEMDSTKVDTTRSALDQLAATDSTKNATADTSDILASLKKTEAADTSAKGRSQMTNEELAKKAPLFAKLQLNVSKEGQLQESPIVGYAPERNKKEVDDMLAKAMAKKIIPSTFKFMWDAKPIKGSDMYALYAISVTTRDGQPLLGGDVVADARQDYSQDGTVEISMNMTTEGAREWKRITGASVGKFIAIVLDGYVYSAPRVNGEIPGGRSQITGQFSVDEAIDLANILKAGKLPAPAKIVQEAVVGPSLGQESINAGMMSFILAFVIVLLYMIFFYSSAGLISGAALITNMFFLFGVLASLGAVLTLPGIAGIVLTMAMAVDANVIINERIKEELRAGKTLATAISEGYKHAYSAIIDGNVTTLLTGIVLVLFGTGPVKGFAITLCVGILTSLFTSIFITRMIMDYLLKKKKKIAFSFSFSENFLANKNIDFVGLRKKFYIGALAVLLISVSALAIRGLNYGIDFQGGRTYIVRFDQDVKTSDIREALSKQFEGDAPEVKTVGSSSQVKITTKYRIEEDSDEVQKDIQNRLYAGCAKSYKKPLTQSEFESTLENPLGIISSETVGPTIANDIKRSAILAVVIALALIFIYIAIRFRKWQYGLGGVVSLANDAIVTIGAFALFNGILPFNLEVDQAFIAAILTIIGYSINDTVIIFDRIREYTHLYPRRTLKDNMNGAINSTLSRTVNTVGSTAVVLLMIFIFGGEVIRGFAFALLLGVVAGAFSSVFIATPIAYDMLTRKQDKKELENVKK